MLLAQQIAAGRVIESAIPIIYISLLAFEYFTEARRGPEALRRHGVGLDAFRLLAVRRRVVHP